VPGAFRSMDKADGPMLAPHGPTQRPIRLDFRQMDGLRRQVDIMARVWRSGGRGRSEFGWVRQPVVQIDWEH